MNSRNASLRLPVALTFSVALILAAAGCIVTNEKTAETRTESQSVPLGSAKSVQVSIKMGAGQLKVGGGASDLMNADFTYNVPRWKPEVHYDAGGGQGHLTVEQPNAGGHLGNTRYEWDLRLNNSVPMEMEVDVGAGQANLNLAGLALTKLSLNLGAGEANIDLDGPWKHDLTASVQGGVGKATLHLPRDAGVRVTAEGGLGAINADGFTKNGKVYTNDAYGKSHVNLNIDVQGGVGEIDLVLGGGSGAV